MGITLDSVITLISIIVTIIFGLIPFIRGINFFSSIMAPRQLVGLWTYSERCKRSTYNSVFFSLLCAVFNAIFCFYFFVVCDQLRTLSFFSIDEQSINNAFFSFTAFFCALSLILYIVRHFMFRKGAKGKKYSKLTHFMGIVVLVIDIVLAGWISFLKLSVWMRLGLLLVVSALISLYLEAEVFESLYSNILSAFFYINKNGERTYVFYAIDPDRYLCSSEPYLNSNTPVSIENKDFIENETLIPTDLSQVTESNANMDMNTKYNYRIEAGNSVIGNDDFEEHSCNMESKYTVNRDKISDSKSRGLFRKNMAAFIFSYIMFVTGVIIFFKLFCFSKEWLRPNAVAIAGSVIATCMIIISGVIVLCIFSDVKDLRNREAEKEKMEREQELLRLIQTEGKTDASKMDAWVKVYSIYKSDLNQEGREEIRRY